MPVPMPVPIPSKNSASFLKCLVYFLLAFLLAAATAHGKSAPAQVIVAVGQDSVPYYFLDRENRPAGLVVDIWKLWSERTGIKVKFSPLPFAETLTAVTQGAADIQAGCFFNEKREKDLDFISPVVDVQTHFFFRRNIFGVQNLDDLRGFRIGIIKGDASH